MYFKLIEGVIKKDMKHSKDSLNKIEEFKSAGFARSSLLLINYMRKVNDSNIRIFRPGSFKAGNSSLKYTTKDIFGCNCFAHIYDARHGEKFADYLVDVFLSKNPNPDAGMRKAFTRILHNNGLHWKYCYHQGKGNNKDE